MGDLVQSCIRHLSHLILKAPVNCDMASPPIPQLQASAAPLAGALGSRRWSWALAWRLPLAAAGFGMGQGPHKELTHWKRP